MNKTKCYIYTRVSTAMQVDGFSLDAQKEKLRRYAEYNDMDVVGEYSDEGKSGKNVEGRIDFVKMLNDIETRKDDIAFVLVFKLSRFGRNAADVLSSLQRMQDYGVNLICVEDGIDSSKESGKLVISVLSAVAEIERENILVQTMEGRRQKAREGKWNGGFAPYGYKLVDGRLEIEEEEAEAIRAIFNQYIHSGMGTTKLAMWMNDHGYVKKIRQNNTLPVFTVHFVTKVLDNPVYCGKIAYGRRSHEKIVGKRNEYHVVKQEKYGLYDGIHEGIVSEEIFEMAQQKRIALGGKRDKVHSLEHEHILSGILKCPCCGESMYGNVSRKYNKKTGEVKDNFYYQCKHRKEIDGKNCGYKKHWTQDSINNAVVDFVLQLVRSPQFEEGIRYKIESRVDTNDLELEIEDLKKSLRQKEGAKNKILSQLDSLDVDDKYYERKYEDMEKRLEKLYEQIELLELQIDDLELRILNVRQNKLNGDAAYNYLLCFDKLYERCTDFEKKEFMNSLIERIEIYEEPLESGKFLKSITFKFPILYNNGEAITLGLDDFNNIETVCLLGRRKPDDTIKVSVNMDDYYQIRDAEEAEKNPS